MQFHHDSSAQLGAPLYDQYADVATPLLRHTAEDKTLSTFVSYNNRFKVSCAMQIDLSGVSNIKRQDTRDCYVLMIKIADLWFSYEHLQRLAREIFPWKKKYKTVDAFDQETMSVLGFDPITENFNCLMRSHVLHTPAFRKQIYLLLEILKENTKDGTQTTIGEIKPLIRDGARLDTRHAMALAYGLRNVYAHKGVAAAMGLDDYRVKKALYLVVYDTLMLYSLALGSAYCRGKLERYREMPTIDDVPAIDNLDN